MHNINIFLSALLNKNPKKFIVVDIDETVVLENGDNSSIDEFKKLIDNRSEDTIFAYATGRNIKSIEEIVKKYNLPIADLYIASVGSAIYYEFNDGSKDCCWDYHIRKKWNVYNLKRSLKNFEGLTIQGEEDQSKTKLSFFTNENQFNYDNLIDKMQKQLKNITLIHSHNAYLDILPARASKVKAIEFIAEKLDIKKENIITAGDSGNDIDMLDSEYKSIIVANHSDELDYLKNRDNCYFSNSEGAKGVIEGLELIEK